jgi:hypothetical protein
MNAAVIGDEHHLLQTEVDALLDGGSELDLKCGRIVGPRAMGGVNHSKSARHCAENALVSPGSSRSDQDRVTSARITTMRVVKPKPHFRLIQRDNLVSIAICGLSDCHVPLPCAAP